MNILDFDLLLKQHETIREKIRVFIEQIGKLKEHPVNPVEEMEAFLKTLIQLLDDHAKREEKVLMPILREIYPSQPEILRYVIQDHEELEEGLTELMGTELLVENIPEINTLLNRIDIHFVEEEEGLFPLVKNFLNNDKSDNRYNQSNLTLNE